MNHRLVDWLLLVFVLFEVLSGLFTFLIGKPEGRWYFVLHAVVGLSLTGLLYWKMARGSSERLRRMPLLSLLVFLLAALAIGTGMTWVSFQVPTGYPNGMILHVTAGLLLLLFLSIHAGMRRLPLRRQDVLSRRNLLASLWLAVLGLGIYGIQHQAGRRLGLKGAERRFTGSRLVEGQLPVTMWMFDKVPEIDLQQWRLQIYGEVDVDTSLSLKDIQSLPTVSARHTLDCTGGWYKPVDWEGIAVSSLLDGAGIKDSARFVSFESVTGYRWSLPIDEARGALLALRQDGTPLSAAHGAPLRLVAPGRRGFQWVKWVKALQVLPSPDLGQWGAIFASGVDDRIRSA